LAKRPTMRSAKKHGGACGESEVVASCVMGKITKLGTSTDDSKVAVLGKQVDKFL
jgi:hypothetical protein